MNPLRQLQESVVLRQAAVESVKVVSASASSLTVRTKSGVREVPYSGAPIVAGEFVRLQGNTVLGRTADLDKLPVFSV